MAPPRKRTKAAHVEDKLPAPILLADYRTAWLVKSDDQDVEIITKDATLRASKRILMQHSEYFDACLKRPYAEADGVVRFDDIDSKYMSFYIGLAYSYSSIVPHASPTPAENPQCSAPKRALRDYVEVFKLCDRFLSQEMAAFIRECIQTAIGDGHRALFRSPTDDDLQKVLMRDFANGFEALEMSHEAQKTLGQQMVTYFCDGVSYSAWDKSMEELATRPKFVGAVSRSFARKLAEVMASGRKPRRRELSGPL